MQTRVEGDRETDQPGKAGPWFWFAYFVTLLGVMALMAAGAQLAFLVRLPHLSTLIRDPQALWLVFSTWPEVRFGTFSLLLVSALPILSGISRESLNPRTLLRRLRGLDQRVIAAILGPSAFLLLMAAIVPRLVLHLAMLIGCAVAGCAVFLWAAAVGVPLRALWLIASFSIGFFGTLLMADANHRPFTCRGGSVQPTSGENLPCSTLVWLDGKPLWLVEGPQPPRLILRRDIDDAEVNTALGL